MNNMLTNKLYSNFDKVDVFRLFEDRRALTHICLHIINALLASSLEGVLWGNNVHIWDVAVVYTYVYTFVPRMDIWAWVGACSRKITCIYGMLLYISVGMYGIVWGNHGIHVYSFCVRDTWLGLVNVLEKWNEKNEKKLWN